MNINETTVYVNPQEARNHPDLLPEIRKVLPEGWDAEEVHLPTGDIVVGDQAIIEIKWTGEDFIDAPRLFDEMFRMASTTFPHRVLLYKDYEGQVRKRDGTWAKRSLLGAFFSEKLHPEKITNLHFDGSVAKVVEVVEKIIRRRGKRPSKMPVPSIPKPGKLYLHTYTDSNGKVVKEWLPKTWEMLVEEGAIAFLAFFITEPGARQYLEGGNCPGDFLWEVEDPGAAKHISSLGKKRHKLAKAILDYHIKQEIHSTETPTKTTGDDGQ